MLCLISAIIMLARIQAVRPVNQFTNEELGLFMTGAGENRVGDRPHVISDKIETQEPWALSRMGYAVLLFSGFSAAGSCNVAASY